MRGWPRKLSRQNAPKKTQWNAFRNKNKSYIQQTGLKDIVEDLAAFLVPVINSLKQGAVFPSTWTRADTWHTNPNQ
jgi:hypothetical protein